jgi:phytoene synthase
VAALVDAGARHDLPLEELRTYMASMRIDCAPVRMATWEQLLSYMDGSAGSVGRIMAALLGVPPAYRADFGRLGQAFQLTNFVRDVREDLRLDRIYLPEEDRARFGVRDEDLARARATPAVRALVAHQVERARGLFAGAEEGVAAAPAAVRPGIRLAVAAYGRILVRAERAGFDVLGRRVGLRPWHFAGVLTTAAVGR